MSFAQKFLIMTVICLSASTIYWMPFLSEIYYVPMQDAFGFSKTELGILSSIFGFTALIGYFPGGYLADRLSSRKLMSSALLVTSAGAFIFATIPPFITCVLLYGIWGIATACLFWSAMIKATRMLAEKTEQGRAFGFLEGGRNFSDMVTSTIFLSIFAFRGGDDAALSEVIVMLALLTLGLAFLVWTVIDDDSGDPDDWYVERPTITSREVFEVLKLPIVWLLAIIIMTAYTGLWGAIYFTPFATDVFGLSAVWGGAIGTGKLWVAFLAAIAAGFVADKIGPAKAVVGSFTLMTAGFLVFALLPGAPDLVPLLVINVAIVSCAVYALRGIYFSLLETGGIPLAVTGIAVGIVSVIGYTPDVFMPVLGGIILDASPGVEGYQNLFFLVAAMSFVGTVAAYLVYRKTKVA
ncbi:MAG: MFS transporter [Halieaceae bacterium]|nr:MFS transporter [Halieaceae bacterium]